MSQNDKNVARIKIITIFGYSFLSNFKLNN